MNIKPLADNVVLKATEAEETASLSAMAGSTNIAASARVSRRVLKRFFIREL